MFEEVYVVRSLCQFEHTDLMLLLIMSDSCLPVRLLLRLVLDGERGHPPAALLEQVQAILTPVHHRHCNLICVPGQAFQQRQEVFLAPAKLVIVTALQ